jgi:hypothetical protein
VVAKADTKIKTNVIHGFDSYKSAIML